MGLDLGLIWLAILIVAEVITQFYASLLRNGLLVQWDFRRASVREQDFTGLGSHPGGAFNEPQ
jgi:hypothetical protein